MSKVKTSSYFDKDRERVAIINHYGDWFGASYSADGLGTPGGDVESEIFDTLTEAQMWVWGKDKVCYAQAD